jgi:DivIVA domain-containing protein
MQIKPEMIREQTFKARLRGFDQEEVKGFLMSIADILEEIMDENRSLHNELDVMRAKQKDLEDLFLQAKRFSDEKLEQATLDAQRVMGEAGQKAKEIQEQAQKLLEKAELEAKDQEDIARQKAREILFEMEKQKIALEREIIELKTKKTSLFAEIKAVLAASQTWLKEMAGVDTKQG